MVSISIFILLISLIAFINMSPRYRNFINRKRGNERHRRQNKKQSSSSSPVPSLFPLSVKDTSGPCDTLTPSPKQFVDVSNQDMIPDLHEDGLVRPPIFVGYNH